MIIAVFNEFSLLKNFGITEKKMIEFISKIRENYSDIPYHNFTNAFDVFQVLEGKCSILIFRHAISTLNKPKC
jgi:hypothetical protein